MYEQIQWTSFGIPYVVEFSNVSFAPHRTTSPSQDTCRTVPTPEESTSISQESQSYSCPSAASSTSSFCHVSHCMLDSPLKSRSSISRLVSLSRSTTIRSASSFFKRKHQKPSAGTYTPSRSMKSFSNPIDTWCSIPPHVPKPLPPLPQPEAEGTHVDGLYIQFAACHPRTPSRSRLACLQKTITSAVVEAGMDTPSVLEEPMNYSRRASDYRGGDSLFRGTYGQVMVALKAAGLVATPCVEGEFAGGMQSHEIRFLFDSFIISYAFRSSLCCESNPRG
jgi:hypothetical protein